MKKHLSFYLLIGILFSACATPNIQQKPQAMQQEKFQKSQPVNSTQQVKRSLDSRSNRSLYLAAQAAIQDNQYDLAIQLLAELSSRSSDVEPKIQLAELWLLMHQPLKAEQTLKPLINSKHDLQIDQATEQNLHFLYAKALAASNQPRPAQQELLLLLRQRPAWEDARVLQIQLYMQQREWSLALQAIELGLKSIPSANFYQLQADIFRQQGKNKQAIASLDKMQQLNPSLSIPAILKSQLLVSMQQNDEAEQVLRRFLKQNPDSLTVHNALGRLLVKGNRLQEAVNIYQKLLQKTGGKAEVHEALGLLYFQQRQFSKAIEHFRIALQQQDNDEYRYYLAASLESVQQAREAGELYQQIQSTSVHWADAVLRLASMAYLEKDYALASKHLKAILKKNTNHHDAWLMLSAIYLAQKKYKQLIQETKAATILAKTPARLLLNRAMAYENLKDYSHVESTLKDLLGRYPSNAEALNFLGYSLAERGVKLDEAKAYIERALAIKPDEPYYLDSLAWVYYQSGNYAKAENIQRSALQKLPDEPVMVEHLGDILWKQKKHAAAREQWQKALDNGHDKPKQLRKKIKQKI